MKHFSLRWKLLFLFAVVSVALFVVLNTIGLNIMQNRTLIRTKEELYQNGTKYVSSYLIEYYEKNISDRRFDSRWRAGEPRLRRFRKGKALWQGGGILPRRKLQICAVYSTLPAQQHTTHIFGFISESKQSLEEVLEP